MNPILARFAPRALAPAGQVPSSIMWMPAGVHAISAFHDGKRVDVTVTVDESTAEVMQAAYQRELETGHRPLIDFDHEHKAAAAWVQGYRWVPGQGVFVDVEWSDRGRAAVTGRTHRAFSPEFFADKAGRVTNAAKYHGGLVNDPAFTAIAPLWARRARPTQPDTMNEENTQAGSQAAENAGELAVIQDAAPALQAARAENETLKAQLAERDSALKAVRIEKADAAIKAAIARGVLPPKDDAAHTKWRNLIIADAGNAELLAGIVANPALQGGAIVQASAFQGVEARDGVVEVLRAFQAKSCPRERSSIYAREISPLLGKGLRMGPILAANALGTLSGELVTQRALSLLKLSFPMLGAISTDFSDAAIAYGQTVKTRLRAVPAVTDYNATTGYATSDATTTDVPVVINNHKAVQISFNANELGSTDRDLFGEQAEGAHYALGKALIDALYALITAGNYTNSTAKALSSFARVDMTAMAKAMFQRAVPAVGRFALLNPDYYEKLQSDSTIVNLAAYQMPEVITQYKLPPIAGFQPYQAVNLPTTGNLTGFAGTPDVLALATRMPNDYSQALPGATGGGVVQTVTNQDTGISVMLVMFVDHKLGGAYWRIAIQFGAAVGNGAAGQRLTSS